EGTHQEARRIRDERREQGRGRISRREEERREEWCQGRVEVEVVPLEHRSERGSEDDSLFLPPDGLYRFRTSRRHHFLRFPLSKFRKPAFRGTTEAPPRLVETARRTVHSLVKDRVQLHPSSFPSRKRK